MGYMSSNETTFFVSWNSRVILNRIRSRKPEVLFEFDDNSQ